MYLHAVPLQSLQIYNTRTCSTLLLQLQTSTITHYKAPIKLAHRATAAQQKKKIKLQHKTLLQTRERSQAHNRTASVCFITGLLTFCKQGFDWIHLSDISRRSKNIYTMSCQVDDKDASNSFLISSEVKMLHYTLLNESANDSKRW